MSQLHSPTSFRSLLKKQNNKKTLTRIKQSTELKLYKELLRGTIIINLHSNKYCSYPHLIISLPTDHLNFHTCLEDHANWVDLDCV